MIRRVTSLDVMLSKGEQIGSCCRSDWLPGFADNALHFLHVSLRELFPSPAVKLSFLVFVAGAKLLDEERFACGFGDIAEFTEPEFNQ